MVTNRRTGVVPATVALLVGCALVHWSVFLRGEGIGTRQRRCARGQTVLLLAAIEDYRRDVGVVPIAEFGLSALVSDGTQSGWLEPYLVPAEVPLDPWGRPYRYDLDRTGIPVVYSVGPDGKPGTRDDVHPVVGNPGTMHRPPWR